MNTSASQHPPSLPYQPSQATPEPGLTTRLHLSVLHSPRFLGLSRIPGFFSFRRNADVRGGRPMQQLRLDEPGLKIRKSLLQPAEGAAVDIAGIGQTGNTGAGIDLAGSDCDWVAAAFVRDRSDVGNRRASRRNFLFRIASKNWRTEL
ncbi:hypothetical protein VTJ49DRAFT_5439 [Mycothermus thermophilus]|uniref:Uncharacterized protein n=1 Tax=Humicola insolens TaxID=85995 RepID=A0ABR3VKP4_HUMIN